MQLKSIITDRLVLREITPSVLDFIYSNYNDSGLMNFFNCSAEQLVEEKEKYKQGLSMFNKSFLYFQLIDKRSSAIIGWCGYHTWYVDHFRAELGYGITNLDFREKGLMREAMKEVIAYGFNEMNLNRIEAMVADYNTASLKTIKRLNFVQEGRMRQHYLDNGKLEDSLIFALLKDDYKD